VKSNVEI